MKIKNNVVDWIFTGLTAAVCLITGVLLAVRWDKIPAEINTHFTMDGTPNGSSGKYMLIVLLGIAVGLFVIFLVVGHFPQAWNMPVKVTDGNRYIVYRLGKYMMDFEQLFITGLLCVFILLTAFQMTTPSWLWIVYIVGLVGGSMIFLILIAVIGAKNA